jgi:hypothetical protein
MKIAILENDSNIIDKIKQTLVDHETSYFHDQYEFIDNCYKYDIALIDQNNLNKEMLERISKYKLETGVLKTGKLVFDDPRISIIIDYDEIPEINERIKYFDAKIRIKQVIETEENSIHQIQNLSGKGGFLKQVEKIETYSETLTHKNYQFDIIENIGILRINGVLKVNEKEEVYALLKTTDFRAAVYLECTINSMNLAMLPVVWKMLNQNKAKCIYWNHDNDTKILSILQLCSLDKLFKILNTIDEIKKEIKGD